jgi:hypothetical protein
MILGQAAGAAAKMAIDQRRPVQEIDTAKLTRELEAKGAVIRLGDSQHAAVPDETHAREKR